MAPATSSPLSSDRPITATRAPSEESFMAIARPMPRVPPVIRAALFSSLMRLLSCPGPLGILPLEVLLQLLLVGLAGSGQWDLRHELRPSGDETLCRPLPLWHRRPPRRSLQTARLPLPVH